jgi:hypothetical protein
VVSPTTTYQSALDIFSQRNDWESLRMSGKSKYTKYLPTIPNMVNTFDIADSNQTQLAPEMLPPRELGTDLLM